MLVPGQVPQEPAPVPFSERADFIRREVHNQQDDNALRLLASVYETHSAWLEKWRMG